MKGNPKLKDNILKYRVKPQTILNVYGELAQIEDKEGIIWSLLELLDGKHTYEKSSKNLPGNIPISITR